VFSWNGTLKIFYLLFFIFYLTGSGLRLVMSKIENRKSKIKNDKPSFLSRDDGFLFCAFLELARERRCKAAIIFGRDGE
jgi:hypothetical protein